MSSVALPGRHGLLSNSTSERSSAGGARAPAAPARIMGEKQEGCWGAAALRTQCQAVARRGSDGARIGTLGKGGERGKTVEEQEEKEGREERELARLKAGMGERRAVDRSERLGENPYAPVESAMTSPAVTTRPDTVVGSLLESLEHFTGLPVVDEAGKCVGIISSIDIFRHQCKASASVTNSTVQEVMTTPAVVIHQHAPIAYAAGLMLKHKVHRLPVVDHDDVVIGIVTRTDIYEPLIPEVNPLFHRLLGKEQREPEY